MLCRHGLLPEWCAACAEPDSVDVDGPHGDVCRACGHPVIRAVTNAGAPMPVSARPTVGGSLALVRGRQPVAVLTAGDVGFRPHSADCGV